MTGTQTRYGQGLIVLLGLFSFAAILAYHNITDGDLWGKLALGASLWEKGHLLRRDIFAFTPTLPLYIEHEWGSGVVFYGCIKYFGPGSLLALKIILACGALAFGIATGRKQGCGMNLLLLMAIPAAACLLPGYIPVLRCHTFSFCFFGAVLLCLETMREGRRWPAVLLPVLILIWTNLHGGFVVGLAAIFIYAAASVMERKQTRIFIVTAVACAAVTFINPYGVKFWEYLIPALLHPRARIAEWRPLPLWANDQFWGFRVLFVLTLAAIAVGWKKVLPRHWRGLAVLLLTVYMGWRSRRHGPFFAVATLAFAGPYFAHCAAQLRPKFNPTWAVGIVYAAIAFYVSLTVLPNVSGQVWAPIGEDPVRETDILSRAGATGNLATPFAWGCYLTWRLYPKIKVSMDGRYETTYPESTFNMNAAFFDHADNWFALCQNYKVDYVILDLHDTLQPADLIARGYVLIWKQDDLSALLCLPEHAAALREAVQSLPPTTIDPLDLKARPAPLFPPGGPNYVVKRGKTPILTANDARKLLNSIPLANHRERLSFTTELTTK